MIVQKVKIGSQAEEQGMKAGDKVVAVNGNPVGDLLDLMFYGGEERIALTVHRGSYEFKALFRGDDEYGIEFGDMQVMRCKNHCVFCFVDQNPPGLRRELYVKDEDYRLSFLYGSYITLTGMSEFELQRIVTQRLSPLYVSVHATDPEIRMHLLGIRTNDRLMETMKRLLGAGIQMHCQIVVCPGINDGEVLARTIRDLRGLHSNILSLAVVPVGLTGHRAGLHHLKPVDRESARSIIGTVERLHDMYAEESGSGFVYPADELYLRAGLPVPEAGFYDDFPQYDNGVGMIRDFIDETAAIDALKGEKPIRTGRFVFVTGESMAPFLGEWAGKVSSIEGITARIVTVKNRFFGDSVTVSGLLSGVDITDALEGELAAGETVVLPPNCLNRDGLFLDDMTREQLAERLGTPVISGTANPLELFFHL